MLRGRGWDAGLWDAARVTALVSVTFMVALAVLGAVMLLVMGGQIAPDMPWPRVVALAMLAGFAALIAVSLWRPRFLLRLYLPPLRAQASILGLTALDTLAAAMVLYVLIPEGSFPPPLLFYSAFLLALGLGLVGTTPGGVGPFEFALLACLPMVPEATLLAAIMGYRIVYFAIPGALAFVALVIGPRLAAKLVPLRPAERAQVRPIIGGPKSAAAGALSFLAPRAEAGLIRQGEFDLLVSPEGLALSPVAPTGQSLIMLARPLLHGLQADLALASLSEAAEERMLIPCLYKCDGRMAATARRLGWQVLKVSDEAVIAPADYDVAVPARRQLRRLLRKAEGAGITVSEAGPQPPLGAMRAVADAWAEARHGVRGFSMGLFEDDYVLAQRVFLAHRGDELVGFVSFHEAWAERTLDLMCHTEDAPPGTSQALLNAAIEAARADEVPRLSLAAVPCLADSLQLPKRASDRLGKVVAAGGLKRFKASFAPRWEPLYLVAPNRVALAVSAVDLVDRITRPRTELRSGS
jgi:phosphatidylglycerol lysyltransferase